MDTNTILLIGLGVVFVLSALAIWLANRQGGVPSQDDNLHADEDLQEENDLREENSKLRED